MSVDVRGGQPDHVQLGARLVEEYVEVANPGEPIYYLIGQFNENGAMFVHHLQSAIFQLGGRDKVARATWCIENRGDDGTANVELANVSDFDAATVRVE